MMTPFANPVHDSQQVFRIVLEALSRPGRVLSVPVLPPQEVLPQGLPSVLAALALTLCDSDTPLWLAPALNTEPVRQWLRFSCSCPLTNEPNAAAFALIDTPAGLPALHTFAQGEAAYPDRSTTLMVAGLSFSPQCQGFSLRGPGIKDSQHLPCHGLPADFAEEWASNTAVYPLGVDILLCAETQLAGLPRTSRMSPQSQQRKEA